MNIPVSIEAAECWWWFGELAVLKLSAEATGGAQSMVEIVAPPGLAVPRHVHHREDELFVMLYGSAEFEVGGKRILARKGDVLFGPMGVPHAYEVGPEGCRMLFGFTPGANMEAFVRASAVPATEAKLPPPDVVPPAPEALQPLLQAHGLAFV